MATARACIQDDAEVDGLGFLDALLQVDPPPPPPPPPGCTIGGGADRCILTLASCHHLSASLVYVLLMWPEEATT